MNGWNLMNTQPSTKRDEFSFTESEKAKISNWIVDVAIGYFSADDAIELIEELLKERNVLKSQGPEQVLGT